jgi:urease accessory protein
MISFDGHLRLHAAVREHGRTVVADQAFRAPFHLSKPYWDGDAQTLIVQVVNPTAGILAGDRLESVLSTGNGAALLVTTPSASRLFTMRDGLAECRQSFSVASRGWLEVSPEPLVPHRGTRYRQSTAIDVEANAGLFFLDQLMPGRLGHGEAWSWSELRLELDVRVGGERVLRERFTHAGPRLKEMAGFAGSGPTACFANAVLIPPDTVQETWRSELESLHRNGVWIGVSRLRKVGWTIKVITPGPVQLRETVAAIRQVLGSTFPRLRCAPRKL